MVLTPVNVNLRSRSSFALCPSLHADKHIWQKKKAIELDEKGGGVRSCHQIHTILSSAFTGDAVVGSTSMLKIVLLRLGARGKPLL